MRSEDRAFIIDHLDSLSPHEIAARLGLKERQVRRVIDAERAARPPAPAAASTHRPTGARPRLFHLIAALIVAALAAGVYANVVTGPFILDDNLLITDNPYVKTWAYVPMFFTRGIGEVVGATSTYYRPLQVLSYTILYHFWKLNTVPYHLLNIFFHTLMALAILWMVNILFKDRVLALFTAAVWAVHPAHVESVAYISGLGDCMVGCMTVLTFALYAKEREARGFPAALFYLAMVASYVVTLFIKENGIIFTGLVALYHVAFRRRPKVLPLASVLAVTGIYLYFRMSLAQTGEAHLTFVSVMQRVPGFFVALFLYAKILPFPFDLYMGHESRLFPLTYPPALAGAAIFLILAAAAIWSWRRHALVFFAIGWFFITIAPVSNLYPIAFYMADHYLYLPSIGVFLVAARGLRLLYDRPIFRIAAAAIASALVVYFGNLTVIQNYYWKDARFFYQRTLDYMPGSARMLSNLAKEHDLEKETDKAIELYKTAVKVDPGHTVAWYNLGVSHFRLGKYDDAIAYCLKAIETDPKYAHSYNIIGASYLARDRYAEAIDAFQKALAIYPNHVDTMLNLATAYYKTGRREDAEEMLKSLLRKNPEYAIGYSNLGFLKSESGDDMSAIVLYEKALELNPRYVDALNNLAFSYYRTGDKEKALELYRRTLEIDPANKRAIDNSALLEQELKK